MPVSFFSFSASSADTSDSLYEAFLLTLPDCAFSANLITPLSFDLTYSLYTFLLFLGTVSAGIYELLLALAAFAPFTAAGNASIAPPKPTSSAVFNASDFAKAFPFSPLAAFILSLPASRALVGRPVIVSAAIPEDILLTAFGSFSPFFTTLTTAFFALFLASRFAPVSIPF